MVVERVAVVLHQPVVQRHQEVVGTGGAVVLLRIEPACGDVGVPCEGQLALRHDRRRTGARRARGQRRRTAGQDAAPVQSEPVRVAVIALHLLPPMAAQVFARVDACCVDAMSCDGIQPRARPRDLVMDTHSLCDRARSLVVCFRSGSATLGDASREPAGEPAARVRRDTAANSAGRRLKCWRGRICAMTRRRQRGVPRPLRALQA